MESGDPGGHLSEAEIAAAIEALPQTSWVRLRKIAEARSRGRPLDSGDLLQETITRALEGERRCPKEVDIVRFLAQAMRSIASDGLKIYRRRGELSLVTQPDDEGNLPLDPPDTRPGPENTLASEYECARIRAATLDLFADDVIAQTLTEGIMEGMEGDELRALTDLDTTAFATKRRLIRRRVEKAFPGGWAS